MMVYRPLNLLYLTEINVGNQTTIIVTFSLP